MKSLDEIKKYIEELPPYAFDRLRGPHKSISALAYLTESPYPSEREISYGRATVKSKPGEYEEATLITFERFYTEIAKKVGNQTTTELIDSLLEIRKQFKSAGDIENSTKTKYLINCIYYEGTRIWDPSLAVNITSTGRKIMEDLMSKLDWVWVDTDQIMVLDFDKSVVDSAIEESGIDLEYEAVDVKDIRVNSNPKLIQYSSCPRI